MSFTGEHSANRASKFENADFGEVRRPCAQKDAASLEEPLLRWRCVWLIRLEPDPQNGNYFCGKVIRQNNGMVAWR
jgi:hypothetical protein